MLAQAQMSAEGGTAAAVYVGAFRVLEGRLLLDDVIVFLAYLGML